MFFTPYARFHCVFSNTIKVANDFFKALCALVPEFGLLVLICKLVLISIMIIAVFEIYCLDFLFMGVSPIMDHISFMILLLVSRRGLVS